MLNRKNISNNSKDYRNIVVDPLNISFGKLNILNDTKFTLQYSEHYGLIGRNGSGKTSLLNYLDNYLQKTFENINVIYVKQEEPESNDHVLEILLESNQKLYEMQSRLIDLETLLELDTDDAPDDQIVNEYDDLNKKIGSEYLKSKAFAQKILFGLGFTNELQNQPVSYFSGGWRMKISLAKALFITPDFLILDEPTNHLDLESIIWLSGYLKKYPNTLIIVAHDRYLIDEICTFIIHIDHQQLNYYQGNYDQFLKQYQIKQEQNKKKYLLQQKLINKLKQQKNKSKLDIIKIEKLIKSNELIKPEREYQVKINFLEPDVLKGTFMSLENVSFGYQSDHLIYQKLNLTITTTTRMALVGRNGTGKSTLLKLINGDLTQIEGEIFKHPALRIGYYHQHFENTLPKNISSVNYLMLLNPKLDLTLAHQYLSTFGLEPAHHKTNIGFLSGGQKARVKIASLGIMKPHLLILDEPSNHLDIVTIDSLIYALNHYQGAIILITHNFELITELNLELWTIQNQQLIKFPGDYDNYLEKIHQELDI